MKSSYDNNTLSYVSSKKPKHKKNKTRILHYTWYQDFDYKVSSWDQFMNRTGANEVNMENGHYRQPSEVRKKQEKERYNIIQNTDKKNRSDRYNGNLIFLLTLLWF